MYKKIIFCMATIIIFTMFLSTNVYAENIWSILGSNCTGEISLDVDANGNPHLLVYKDAKLFYMHKDESGWHEEDLPDGSGYNSLAVSSDGTLHVCYVRADQQAVLYTYKNGEHWADVKAVSERYSSYEYTYPCIELDQDGRPHISVIEQWRGALMYLSQDSSGVWSTVDVVQGGYSGGRPNPKAYFCSLAINPVSGNPAISYTGMEKGWTKFYYAWKDDENVWHKESIGLSMNIPIALQFSSDGTPYIVYCSSFSNDKLKLYSKTGERWNNETVDVSSSNYTSMTLDFNSKGKPGIAYIDRNNRIKYAWQDSDGWHIETISTKNSSGYNRRTFIKYDNKDNPHIAYVDDSNNLLYTSKIEISSKDINFGNVRYGDNPSQSVTLTNNTYSDLSIESIDYPPGFTSDVILPSQIIQGESLQIHLTFSPEQERNYNDHITFHINDGSSFNIGVKGTLLSSNANLSNLELSEALLEFNPDTSSYDAEVANNIESISITPTAAHGQASITIDDLPISSGTSYPKNLSVGENLVNIKVTAQDEVTEKTYTLSIKRKPCLDGLSLSSNSLQPTFSKDTTNYTVEVEASTINVTPLVAGEESITVNDTPIISGNPSQDIQLDLGENIINIVVTSADGQSATSYIIAVNRVLSSNSKLSGLIISDGSLSPSFSEDTLHYNVTVGNDVEVITVTTTADDEDASITVNGSPVVNGAESQSINLGEDTINTIAIEVTAQNGINSSTYTITVDRAASANLSRLVISDVELNPEFSSATYEYTANVDNRVDKVTVTPIAVDAEAVIQINDEIVSNGETSSWIDLEVGDNRILCQVTGSDSIAEKTYTIILHRASSANADISCFTMAEQTGPAIIGEGTIEIEVEYGTDVTALVPTITVSENATIEPLSGEAQDFTSPVTYTVTAENGSTNEWEITVTIGPEITMTASPQEVTESNIFEWIVKLFIHNDTVAEAVYAKDISLSEDFSTLNIGIVTRENPTTVAAAVYGNLSYNTGIGIITLDDTVLEKSRDPLSTNIAIVPKTIPVDSINVTAPVNTVEEGATLQMTAEVMPENVTDKTFTWSVIEGTGSATINQDGLLTGTSAGKIIVKATANDGSGMEGSLEITVTETVPPADIIAPTLTDSTITINASGQNTTRVTLSWTKASDDRTQQEELEYLVYRSNVNNINSLAYVETNGTPVGSYTVDINNKEITGLIVGNTYYFNIIVKDEAGNKTAYNMVKIQLDDDTGGGSSSDDDDNDNDTSDNDTSSVEKNDKALKEAIERNNNATLSLDNTKDTQVQITPELVQKLGAKNRSLIVENTGIVLQFSPQSLVTNELTQSIGNEGAKLELGAQEVNKAEKQEILDKAQLGENTGLFDIGGKVFDLTAQIVDQSGDKTKINSFNEPVAVTIDLSDMDLTEEEITNLTGIRYEKDEQGNIVPVKLGGSYDPETKTFTFYTDQFGLYGILKADKLTKISLTIGSIHSVVNGQQITNDVAPTIINNRTMVPLRFIGESLGADVKWIGEERKVSIELDNKTLELFIDQPIATFGTQATIINNRVLVPLRYIAEMLNSSIQWFPKTREVYIVK